MEGVPLVTGKVLKKFPKIYWSRYSYFRFDIFTNSAKAGVFTNTGNTWYAWHFLRHIIASKIIRVILTSCSGRGDCSRWIVRNLSKAGACAGAVDRDEHDLNFCQVFSKRSSPMQAWNRGHKPVYTVSRWKTRNAQPLPSPTAMFSSQVRQRCLVKLLYWFEI